MRGEAKLTRFQFRELPSAGPSAQVPEASPRRICSLTTMHFRTGRRGAGGRVAGLLL
jgi:hypothetical protein